MTEINQSESDRITKNLHDETGMLLNVVRLNLTKISRNIEDKALSQQLIKQNITLLEDSIKQIRDIASNIMPGTLTKLGYAKAISELCRQINATYQIKVSIVINTDKSHHIMIDLQIYRITQEVLNNILKYANASEINISINSKEKGICTIISHNGKGITSEMAEQLVKNREGNGLKIIQDRAAMISASVQYIHISSSEYKITIDIPYYGEKN